ncbi:MAG: long-chain fatty acid--CoA ligase [Gaiellaceae bacterium]
MTARTLNEMLAQSVERFANKPAFIFKGETTTFAQLADEIERCAAGLAELGIAKGDTFGIVMRNCPEFVILSFALSRLGAVAVPVNFLEKADRIAFIFNDAEVKGCLTSKEFLRTIREVRESVPTLEHIFLRDPGGDEPALETIYRHPLDEAAGPEVSPNDLVLLIYTAGTTGLPKGVMLTQRNLLFSVESCLLAFDLTSKDRVMCVLPMFHSFAWTTNVVLPLRLGATTVVIESLLPLPPALKQLWKHKVTLVCCIPQVYSALVQHIHGPKAWLLRLLNPLDMAISGAAPLPAAVQIKFEKTFGTALLEGYGLTEAAPAVSVNPRYGTHKPGTVGLPLPGIDIKIVDDDERELESPEIGEVCVRGDNIMAGYYKRPEETKEAFTADGWLKTGDLGFLDSDGYLTLVDRKKDLIIIKGFNVYPQEVEAALVVHPAVAEVAAVGIPDASGDESVRAFVVLEPGQSIKPRELIGFVRPSLASYKMPKEIEIVDELPKNALGKVLKRELRAGAAAAKS